MKLIGEILTDAFHTGLLQARPAVERQPDAAGSHVLAARLAGSIAGLDPALRLLLAQRVIGYARDLLVRPLSPAGGHLLDETIHKLGGLTSSPPKAPANDIG